MRIKIDPDLELIPVPRLLVEHLRDHLDFMNHGAVYAAAKVEPVSHATAYLIDTLDTIMADNPRPRVTRKKRPTPTPNRADEKETRHE